MPQCRLSLSIVLRVFLVRLQSMRMCWKSSETEIPFWRLALCWRKALRVFELSVSPFIAFIVDFIASDREISVFSFSWAEFGSFRLEDARVPVSRTVASLMKSSHMLPKMTD